MSHLTASLKKPWVVMPLVALLALGGWWTLVRDDTPDASAQAVLTDQVVEVTVGEMAKTVTAEGTVEAAETEDLSFSSAGTVTAVDVEAGDVVSAGDVLAEIDSAELEAAVADAEAAVADAEATLADGEATLADDEDAGASDGQLEADRSSLTSAQDQLAAAQEALEGAQLVATIDGTVATVDLTVGEELSSGGAGGTTPTGSGSGSGGSASTLGSASSTSSAPGATTTGTDSTSTADIAITSAGRYTVSLGFDDTDIASLAVGQLAEISLSTSSQSSTDSMFPGGGFPGGFPGASGSSSTDATADDAETSTPTTTGESVEGLVTEVGTVADASSGTASYPVTVSFRDDSGDFNAGATVSVTITYDEVADAVSVPTRAITTTDGTATVEVQTDDGTETRAVETGLVDGTMTQITSGLVAGESVVIEAPSFGGPGGSSSEDGGFTPPEGVELPSGDAPAATSGEEGGS